MNNQRFITVFYSMRSLNNIYANKLKDLGNNDDKPSTGELKAGREKGV